MVVQYDKIHAEIHDALNKQKGLVISSMRSGKTKAFIDWIHSKQFKKVLWVTPETKLRDTDLPEEFIKWRRKSLLKNMTFVCYDSLHKVKDSFDLIILDEYQHLTELNSSQLNKNVKYTHIVGMTGTHPKKQDKQDILDKLELEIVYNLSVDNAVEEGIVAPYQLNIVYFDMDTKKNLINSKGIKLSEKQKYERFDYVIMSKLRKGEDAGMMFEIRRRMIYSLNSRNEALKKIMNYNKNKRGIIFTPFKKTTEELCKHFYHSTSGENAYNLFKEEKVNQLGLVKKGGTGHTYQNLDFAIISQSTSDNTGLTSQSWSRTLLPRKGYKAQIYILCARGTQDEKWVASAISNYQNIKYDDIKNY